MANTFVLIQSTVLGSNQGNIVFSSIPQTYTDLYLKISARSNRTGSYYDGIYITSNIATTSFSQTDLYGTGTSVASSMGTGGGGFFANNDTVVVASDTATSSTFGNTEIYFPSYASSLGKIASASSVAESNTALQGPRIALSAGLRNTTTAINSLTIFPFSGTNFLTGSSFYLYGIKNA